MMKDICFRYFPSRSRIVQPSFSRSSNAREQKASAKETSKHCLKRWNGSRRQGATCKNGGVDYAVLSKARRNSAKTSYLVSSQRRRPHIQERRHRLRTRHHHGRFQRSVLDHVSPAAADPRPQREAVEMRRAEKSDRQSIASSSFKDGDNSAPGRCLYRSYSDPI